MVGAMVANGVPSIRVAFNWAAAEPYASWSKVPAVGREEYTDVNGKPFLFTHTNEIVGAAAQHGVTVLPTVLYTPSRDTRNNKQDRSTRLSAPGPTANI